MTGAAGLGLLIGMIFGAAAQAGRFCLLRGFRDRDPMALRAFALALAVAVLATQGLAAAGLVDLGNSLPLRPRWSLGGALAGGVIFGCGMVLANGCGARAVVLAASGNLRALVTLGALAVAAQASLTGILAPVRGWVQALAVIEPGRSPLPFPLPVAVPLPVAALAVAALLAFALPLRRRPVEAASALVIGLAIAGGWWAVHATDDPFDPKVLTAISYIAPTADSLLYLMLATGRSPGFGVALVAGTALGAGVMALFRRQTRVEGFTAPPQMLRAITGGALMGLGGVLATGCSIGQGLSGVSTLSLASLVALAGILAGIAVAQALTPHPAPRS